MVLGDSEFNPETSYLLDHAWLGLARRRPLSLPGGSSIHIVEFLLIFLCKMSAIERRPPLLEVAMNVHETRFGEIYDVAANLCGMCGVSPSSF